MASELGAMRFREMLSEIVKRYLDAGHSIEVEGLGTFRSAPEAAVADRSPSPRYVFTPECSARIFIAYAVEDFPAARKLSDDLRAHGCLPWLDKEQLLPGQNWPRAIEQSIDVADVFVACFSPRSVAKHGQFQCEIRYALDCARRRPLDESFVIPARIEPCRVPRQLSDHLQYIDLFADWEKGVRLIARTAKNAAKHRPAAVLK
jgi:hypothetical protein